MISFLRAHHKKIREIGVGLFIYETFNHLYDFGFYPFAIAYWGIVRGGAIAAGITFITNAFVFWLYEYMAVDWLGAHALRELDAEEDKSEVSKLLSWLGRKKESVWEKLMSPIVFVGLLLPVDPVIVAVHYRRHHFRGITLRDWGLLFLATAVANAWWLLKVGLIVEGALYLWHIFFMG